MIGKNNWILCCDVHRTVNNSSAPSFSMIAICFWLITSGVHVRCNVKSTLLWFSSIVSTLVNHSLLLTKFIQTILYHIINVTFTQTTEHYYYFYVNSYPLESITWCQCYIETECITFFSQFKQVSRIFLSHAAINISLCWLLISFCNWYVQ